MNTSNENENEWEKSPTKIFWGEIAPCNHLVQIYDHDDIMLDSLHGFVSSGLEDGDSVIIIATDAHLKVLHNRLIEHGFDVESLIANDRYIPLNAQETLNKFMVNKMPDEQRFFALVNNLVLRARGKENRRVRAYGEMVAILWEQGFNGATVTLEFLWHKFCQTEAFCLFCAYPKTAFTQDMKTSIEQICAAHDKVIGGHIKSTQEIYHR